MSWRLKLGMAAEADDVLVKYEDFLNSGRLVGEGGTCRA